MLALNWLENEYKLCVVGIYFTSYEYESHDLCVEYEYEYDSYDYSSCNENPLGSVLCTHVP